MLYPVQLPLSTDAPKLATLTRPNATFWELELHAGPHNTLTTFVIMECLMKAFDIVEKDWRDTGGLKKDGRPSYKPGAFVITGARTDRNKYFSRGTPSFFSLDSTRFTLTDGVSMHQGLLPKKLDLPGSLIVGT
jgi:hypothetical protein